MKAVDEEEEKVRRILNWSAPPSSMRMAQIRRARSSSPHLHAIIRGVLPFVVAALMNPVDRDRETR